MVGFNPSEKYDFVSWAYDIPNLYGKIIKMFQTTNHLYFFPQKRRMDVLIWAMVNTHYMVDGHPIHNKDPYNGYYKSLWTIGWLAPINGYEPWVLTIAHMSWLLLVLLGFAPRHWACAVVLFDRTLCFVRQNSTFQAPNRSNLALEAAL